MRFIFLVVSIIFIGCGSGVKKINEAGSDRMTESSQELNSIQGVAKYERVSDIKNLIQNSNEKLRYIVVGDSTRSREDSPRYFEKFSQNLQNAGVESYLVAKSGHKLSEFISEDSTPTYHDVVDLIDGSGEGTIVDISLAINDLWDYNNPQDHKSEIQARLKRDLKKAMELIKKEKPDVIFIFTSPNPMQSWDEGTALYMEVYRELSSELHIPFIDFYDNVFVNLSKDEKRSLYRHGGADHIHYSTKGQLMMVEYVSKALGLL